MFPLRAGGGDDLPLVHGVLYPVHFLIGLVSLARQKEGIPLFQHGKGGTDGMGAVRLHHGEGGCRQESR